MGLPPLDSERLPDWYSTLELTREASSGMIRAAYKRLAFQYHPDKTLDEKLKPEMTKRFTEIQEAYEVLSNSQRKLEYDEDLRLEAMMFEDLRRAKEKSKRAAGVRQQRRQEARRHDVNDIDARAEAEYVSAKRQEDEMIAAALKAQQARKSQAAEHERKKTDTDKKKKDSERQERKRREQQQQQQQQEEMARRESELREQEKLQKEDDRRRRNKDSEQRTRDRRRDRGDKEYHAQPFPIDDLLDPEPPHFEKTRDRGRVSKEGLREPSFHMSRDHSKNRDRSRNRERERDSSRNRDRRDRERDFDSKVSSRDEYTSRSARFHAEGRRTSSDPIHEDPYLHPDAYYGSPHSYSHRSSNRSPSPPRLRNSNPNMHSSAYNYPTPNKGRDRTRDRPGGGLRKPSEAGMYSRGDSYASIPEDSPSYSGNRDSGYSTSSAGTPHRNGLDPRESNERMDSKKYKSSSYIYEDHDPEEDDDDTSTVRHRSRPSRRSASKQTSREDTHHAYASPRHQPPVGDDVFSYMDTSGPSKPYVFNPKDLNMSSKPTKVHVRHNSSDLGSNPTINIDNYGTPSKSRGVPAGTPGLPRHATWTG